jgi:hypothetical protein
VANHAFVFVWHFVSTRAVEVCTTPYPPALSLCTLAVSCYSARQDMNEPCLDLALLCALIRAAVHLRVAVLPECHRAALPNLFRPAADRGKWKKKKGLVMTVGNGLATGVIRSHTTECRVEQVPEAVGLAVPQLALLYPAPAPAQGLGPGPPPPPPAQHAAHAAGPAAAAAAAAAPTEDLVGRGKRTRKLTQKVAEGEAEKKAREDVRRHKIVKPSKTSLLQIVPGRQIKRAAVAPPAAAAVVQPLPVGSTQGAFVDLSAVSYAALMKLAAQLLVDNSAGATGISCAILSRLEKLFAALNLRANICVAFAAALTGEQATKKNRTKRLRPKEADKKLEDALQNVKKARGHRRELKRATSAVYRLLLGAFSSLTAKRDLAVRMLEKLQDVLDGKKKLFPIMHGADWRRVVDEDAWGMHAARHDALFLVAGDGDYVLANLQLPGNVKAAVWIRFSRHGTVLINDAVATKSAIMKLLLPAALADVEPLTLARSGVELDLSLARTALAWAMSVVVAAWVGMSDFGTTFRFQGRGVKTHFVGLKNFMSLLDEYLDSQEGPMTFLCFEHFLNWVAAKRGHTVLAMLARKPKERRNFLDGLLKSTWTIVFQPVQTRSRAGLALCKTTLVDLFGIRDFSVIETHVSTVISSSASTVVRHQGERKVLALPQSAHAWTLVKKGPAAAVSSVPKAPQQQRPKAAHKRPIKAKVDVQVGAGNEPNSVTRADPASGGSSSGPPQFPAGPVQQSAAFGGPPDP